MNSLEFLVGYGLVGEFGRFRATRPLCFDRADLVVVRTHRGVEIGHVLMPAAPGHAIHLPNTTVGQLLRPVNSDDRQVEDRLRAKTAELLIRANSLAGEWDMPIDVLDVELLHDGEHAVLHHVRADHFDVREYVSKLSREFGLHVLLVDLAGFTAADEKEEPICERCGSTEGGCGSGGGCGSCSANSSCATHAVAAVETDRVTLL
ncbi:MAG: PSP1 C-terminal domain-containing protein [Candidatus Acidiferrum sp.]